MVIREAHNGDAEALAALYRLLSPSPHIDVRPDPVNALAADPHTYLLVCEMEGDVCGTALLTKCLDAMYGNQPYGVIEHVVVAKESRGQGGAMFAHVEGLCRTHDCSKMMLLSADARADAHRLVERCGFSADRKQGFVKYRSQIVSSER